MIDEILKTRELIVESLRRELLGPHDGDKEVLHEDPHKRYIAGTLYPRNSSVEHIAEEEDVEEVNGAAGGNAEEDQADDPIVLANQYLPSSMGISFYLRNDPSIEVQVIAARYLGTDQKLDNGSEQEQKQGKKSWLRTPVIAPEPGTALVLAPEGNSNKVERVIYNGAARLNAIWRQSAHGWLVTVTIINNKITGRSTSPQVEDCLYQVGLHCRPASAGNIAEYPRNRLATEDQEELLLDLLYRHQVAYGVGHGCSVIWSKPSNGTTSEIWTEMLPTCEVPPIAYSLGDDYDLVLTLSFLAFQDDAGSPDKLISELNKFVAGYYTWIEGLILKHQDIPADLTGARDTLLQRLQNTHTRMKDGIKLLEKDATIRRAFCLANRAMLMQMVHSSKAYAGTRHAFGEMLYSEPDISKEHEKKWRPFQLAFQLLTVASIAFPDDPYRKVVDLIWFPTGGGKTEAYLAATAFLIFYRLMTYGAAGSGTAVLMRYTLRLLTTQQFRRASALICACELLRRQHPRELGSKEISIGLWVGSGATPNNYRDAHEKYNNLLEEDEPKNPFQIDRCPWCGTEIVPGKRNNNRDMYGIHSTRFSFSMFCPNNSCPFHNKIPLSLVDEQLYDQPPTLLLGTVDKFASLPWEARVGEFFGGDTRRPPDLIIQDELHLISGPLGTIVGIYETAIDAMASWNGTPPKILASTATIRRADEQCLGLYARKVELFPPSGLDADDSYFARFDYTRPGRLYVGVLGAAHTASTTMIRTSAALLQAPVDLHLKNPVYDAYWTLVAYHNSLRELGKSRTFAADDIPARIKVIAHDQKYRRDLNYDKVQELTSNVDATRLGEILNRLEISTKEGEKDEAVGLLLCTNMLSVGVDVQRLGVMLVNGQPKSTSEYIQSTSRVGRGEVPGLVVCVYSPSKPRDRSHYERFVAYHSSLYRQVEPTSVTPFALPSRNRALHAVLVSLVRHKTGLSGLEDASRFSLKLPGLDRIIDILKNRVVSIDPREVDATAMQINLLLEQWQNWAMRNNNLEYNTSSRAKESLLFNIGDDHPVGWPTLRSMRNVDQNCIVKIIGV